MELRRGGAHQQLANRIYYMNRKKLIKGLALIDAAIFIITVQFFLPPPLLYTYTNAVEGYFNGRTHWIRAWIVLLASILIRAAIVIMFGRDEPKISKSDAA